jgi:RNA polymerase sigma-70 factor, ECF subfamily
MSTDLDPERDLVARCTAKQPGAWSDFVDRYVGLVYHIIEHSAHARDIEFGESQKRDLCEDVFEWLLADDMAALRDFSWESNFVTWLGVVGRRRVIHRMIERGAAEKLGHVDAGGEASIALPAEADEDVEEAELIDPGEPVVDAPRPEADPPEEPAPDVDRLLDGLDWEASQVVRRHVVEGKTPEEIAHTLGLGPDRVVEILAQVEQRRAQSADENASDESAGS